jgi:hypothetical protein
VGAAIMVLGAQGVPGFPKFSCTDPDGWASVLIIPAAIMQPAAKAINFRFVIYILQLLEMVDRPFRPTNGRYKLTP